MVSRTTGLDDEVPGLPGCAVTGAHVQDRRVDEPPPQVCDQVCTGQPLPDAALLSPVQTWQPVPARQARAVVHRAARAVVHRAGRVVVGPTDHYRSCNSLPVHSGRNSAATAATTKNVAN